MTQLIAEIGWNHGGNIELAKKMIWAAKENGADYAKFQTWSVKRLKDGIWDSDGRRKVYEKAELTEEKHKDLINFCNRVGIEFLSSVFSIEDAQLLVELGIKKVKIPSFESRNIGLIQYCNRHFDMVFMSTGTSTLDEIRASASHFKGQNSYYLLHCVSFYPCTEKIANLPKMIRLKQITDNVGYSDHIPGIESAKVAICEGAQVIEKHFTTDQNLPGRDNKFAILPKDLFELRKFITFREQMLFDHGDGYRPEELDARENYTGRFNKS